MDSFIFSGKPAVILCSVVKVKNNLSEMDFQIDANSNGSTAAAAASARMRKLEKKWTFEEDELMVKMISEREAIWNSNSVIYTDKSLKSRSWVEISEKIGHSVRDAKNRWNTIKSRFNLERKKMLKRETLSDESAYECKYKLYPALQFLLLSELSQGREKDVGSIQESSQSTTASPLPTFNFSEEVKIHDNKHTKSKRKRMSSHSYFFSSPFRRNSFESISGLQTRQPSASRTSKWKKIFAKYVQYELDRYEYDDAQNLKKQLTKVCVEFQPAQKASYEIIDASLLEHKNIKEDNSDDD